MKAAYASVKETEAKRDVEGGHAAQERYDKLKTELADDQPFVGGGGDGL